MKFKLISALSAIITIACTPGNKPSVSSEDWGSADAKPVHLFTLTNSNGVTAKITDYGGIIVEFYAPDKNGKLDNIVLGLTSLDDYLAGHPAFGCIVGRTINRIGGAKFTLDGTEYTLAKNSLGKHNIHGGVNNFASKVWNATTASDSKSATLSLTYLSADMEEGFPGNLTVKVDYVLNNDNELRISYTATTDKPTVVNLSNHSYFNLTGCKENVLGHEVRIYADAYTPTDDELIPTGEIVPVEGTPYDLREWTRISDRLAELPKGYDNNFCVGGMPGDPVLVAEMYEPKSGRLLQTYTTQPGLCFYTAHGMKMNRSTPHGVPYTSSMGACFETQHYPDSPNHPNFPSTVLRPGEVYEQLTIYKVGVK